jgi:hypothetical protein
VKSNVCGFCGVKAYILAAEQNHHIGIMEWWNGGKMGCS